MKPTEKQVMNYVKTIFFTCSFAMTVMVIGANAQANCSGDFDRSRVYDVKNPDGGMVVLAGDARSFFENSCPRSVSIVMNAESNMAVVTQIPSLAPEGGVVLAGGGNSSLQQISLGASVGGANRQVICETDSIAIIYAGIEKTTYGCRYSKRGTGSQGPRIRF